MIITKLQGGLGNQMFQYAIARQLAKKLKTKFKMDISMFENYSLHTYSMKPLNIFEDIASNKDIENLNIFKKNTFIERILRKIFHKQKKLHPRYFKEKSFNFNPNILEAPDNIYLNGYWQSEKYFPNIKKELKKEFTVKLPAKGKNKIFLDEIKETNSISLHIRRTNYVTNPKTNKTHGTCSLGYYYKSVTEITKKIDNPRFFIFSDDPQWARSNLKIPYPTFFIDHNNAEKDYEDLRLMYTCKHNIIANSTFSWWGAWLNKNPDKIVVAPKKWFNNPETNTQDLIPKSWLQI